MSIRIKNNIVTIDVLHLRAKNSFKQQQWPFHDLAAHRPAHVLVRMHIAGEASTVSVTWACDGLVSGHRHDPWYILQCSVAPSGA